MESHKAPVGELSGQPGVLSVREVRKSIMRPTSLQIRGLGRPPEKGSWGSENPAGKSRGQPEGLRGQLEGLRARPEGLGASQLVQEGCQGSRGYYRSSTPSELLAGPLMCISKVVTMLYPAVCCISLHFLREKIKIIIKKGTKVCLP